MSDGERDAFGNPIQAPGAPRPAPPSAPGDSEALTPDLGAFSPPVAPPPAQAAGGPLSGRSIPGPPAPGPAPGPQPAGGHTIATGHHTGTVGGTWTSSPAPTATAAGANTALALGIGTLFFPPLAPLAWVQGRRVQRVIDASRGELGGRGMATTAVVIGMVMSLLWLLVIVVAIVGNRT